MGRVNRHYILEDHKVIRVDFEAWMKWFGKADRRVALDVLDDVEISTVFLGIDHSFDSRVPRLFETMIFGGKFDQTMARYPTWQDAEAGHAKWVGYVKADKSRSFSREVR